MAKREFMNEGVLATTTGYTIVSYDAQGNWVAINGLIKGGGNGVNIVATFKVKFLGIPLKTTGKPLSLIFSDNQRKITSDYNKARYVLK